MIETDLKKIAQAAEENQEENMKFRTFLKGYCSLSIEQTDEMVHRLTREIAARIDCDKCRNCCGLPPTIEEGDIPALAAAMGVDEQEFMRRYVEADESGDIALVKPCPFLQEQGTDRTCTAGGAKPTACQEYPFLLKPDFAARLLGVVQRYGECPIVYNVYERLKKELAGEYLAAGEDIDDLWDQFESPEQ